MPFPIITGTLLALLQKQKYRFDPTRGEVIISDYKGANQSNIIGIANTAAAQGIAYELDLERGIAILTLDDATLNNPIDTWELSGNDERLDLFQNPLWGNDITDIQMSAIRAHLDNGDPIHGSGGGVGAFDTPDASSNLASLTGLAGTVVERAYARYQAGNEEFENDAYGGGYVLRHTTNVPARWTTNIADFNVGFVYSTAHLITEISGGLWFFPAPSRLVYKINHIPVPILRENFFWGWKKGRSNEETTANNRVNIIQSYILELWSTDDYNAF